MADFDAQLPVRALAVNFTTEVANAAGTTINPAEDYAQASTTSGENNVLVAGATTTAAPVYTTATTNPLSLDTAGNLRVTGSITIPGTVTVIQPTGTLLHTTVDNFPADADALAQGSTTAGQLGALEMGAVTTAAPTYVTGQTNAVSLNTSGELRVVTASDSTTAINGNVTVVQPTGTNLHVVSDTGSVVAVSNFPADADALAQASTTSGQLGALVMGATTTAAPVYTTATTNPLSIDTAGNLRVSATQGVVPVVLTYFTDAAVATSATVTHSVAGPTNLDAVHSSGSGELKMTVAIGTTGSEVTFWQGFTSASTQNCEFYLKNSYVIPAGQSVKVTLKNRDLLAQDLYLTFVTH